MSYRNVLLPISGEHHDESALRAASQIARLHDGHIDGLLIQIDLIREISLRDESMSAILIRDLAKSVQESNHQAEQFARRRFEKILAEEDIPLNVASDPKLTPSATWNTAVGRQVETVSMKGGAYDLIVYSLDLSRSKHDATEIFEALLFRSGRPVLLVPKVLPANIGKTVVLCWNRTVQSARAVVAAMPFLVRADRVILLSVLTGAKQGPDPNDLARTLTWHGILTDIVEVDPDGRAVGRILLDESAKVSADLMIMGGYSRNRWSEVILGGVTRYILDNAEMPILMAH